MSTLFLPKWKFIDITTKTSNFRENNILPSRPGFFEILALTLSDCLNFVAAAINLLLLGISNSSC